MYTTIPGIKDLIALAEAPNTHDKDRYARQVRTAAKAALLETKREEAFADFIPTLAELWTNQLNGLLRSVTRENPVAVTRRHVVVLLDSMEVLSGWHFTWRKPRYVTDPDNADLQVYRDVVHLQGPSPRPCTCLSDPEGACYATIHDI